MFHLRISSQIFFYYCNIVWWKLCLITRIHSKSIFVKTFEFVAWRQRLSDLKLIFALRKPMQQLLGIKEKTKFSNVDNFYKGKFPSLSDFFISLHTLARWIFASMPKLPKYNTENAGMIHSKSQVDEINRTLQSIFDTYLTYYSPQWRMCIWLFFCFFLT